MSQQVTATVSDAKKNWLTRIADDLDISEAEVMRRCIQLVIQHDDPHTALAEYGDSTADADRVRAIVRDELHTLGVIDAGTDNGADVASEPERSHAPRALSHEDAIEAALDGWQHGRNDEERSANHELAHHATQWLRDHGDKVEKGDCPLDDWQAIDDHPDAPRSLTTIWNAVIADAWTHAPDHLIQSGFRSYQWVGDE